MTLNDIINSLKNMAVEYVCKDEESLDIEMVLEEDLSERLVVKWVDHIDTARLKIELNFDTVALFDVRFNTVLYPLNLKQCTIKNLDTSTPVELEDPSLELSRIERNTIIASLKMYMAQEQLNNGDVAYPFSIA